jgi:uncharacterized oligopeptide transporter (OPT) family protein
MRVFSGVVLGYFFFEGLWYLLFRVTNTDPHAPASVSFQAGAVAFGILFAVAAGFMASFIGGRADSIAAWGAGGLVVVTAIVMMTRKGVAWPQMTALLFMAPAVVVGGSAYVLRRRRRADGDSK